MTKPAASFNWAWIFGVAIILAAAIGAYAALHGKRAAPSAAIPVSPPVWHMSGEQKEKLGRQLDQIPAQQRFEIKLECSLDPNSQAYAADLRDLFAAHQWNLSGQCAAGSKAGTGLWIAVTSAVADSMITGNDLRPAGAKTLAALFVQAAIPVNLNFDAGLTDNNDFFLVVGNGPYQ